MPALIEEVTVDVDGRQVITLRLPNAKEYLDDVLDNLIAFLANRTRSFAGLVFVSNPSLPEQLDTTSIKCIMELCGEDSESLDRVVVISSTSSPSQVPDPPLRELADAGATMMQSCQSEDGVHYALEALTRRHHSPSSRTTIFLNDTDDSATTTTTHRELNNLRKHLRRQFTLTSSLHTNLSESTTNLHHLTEKNDVLKSENIRIRANFQVHLEEMDEMRGVVRAKDCAYQQVEEQLGEMCVERDRWRTECDEIRGELVRVQKEKQEVLEERNLALQAREAVEAQNAELLRCATAELRDLEAKEEHIHVRFPGPPPVVQDRTQRTRKPGGGGRSKESARLVFGRTKTKEARRIRFLAGASVSLASVEKIPRLLANAPTKTPHVAMEPFTNTIHLEDAQQPEDGSSSSESDQTLLPLPLPVPLPLPLPLPRPTDHILSAQGHKETWIELGGSDGQVRVEALLLQQQPQPQPHPRAATRNADSDSESTWPLTPYLQSCSPSLNHDGFWVVGRGTSGSGCRRPSPQVLQL